MVVVIIPLHADGGCDHTITCRWWLRSYHYMSMVVAIIPLHADGGCDHTITCRWWLRSYHYMPMVVVIIPLHVDGGCDHTITCDHSITCRRLKRQQGVCKQPAKISRAAYLMTIAMKFPITKRALLCHLFSRSVSPFNSNIPVDLGCVHSIPHNPLVWARVPDVIRHVRHFPPLCLV